MQRDALILRDGEADPSRLSDEGRSPTQERASDKVLGNWIDEIKELVQVRALRSQSLTLMEHSSAVAEIERAAARKPRRDSVDDAVLRHSRRAMSAENLSWSMLQQELGYPRPRGSIGRLSSRRSRNSRRESQSPGAEETDSATRPPFSDGKDGDKTSALESPASFDEDILEGDQEEEEGGEDEENNFLDERVAGVTGYTKDTDGIVFYEITVESATHGPLSAYKVRRRYSEFREFHQELKKVMRATASDQTHRYKAVGSAASSYQQYSSTADTMASSLHSEPLPASSSLRLPPLPDNGGFWSFLQGSSPSFLQHRARSFHEIVVFAQQDPHARASRLLNNFLGPPPDSSANAYVSLNRFAAPQLHFAVEIQERKEIARTINLKRRQLEPLYPPLPSTI
ncbi:hypothetical protein Poli38472_010343 [Pythium oligandrum]|uniref:PX domain-containing protein n=1 Tax=Pythium oligandrum TaxID=41045 RepID=A0A8K1C2V7_PYTOL|nr:hypothetical protein Poli38472_010343 [Pythium oligandrum]|eukprot:TMW55461.1 hypothetical protein Poli38472_010343 [Pythium oligandrum]